ncbi:MAG: dipicolinate synthase subunit DpsA [Lachnospiraceae bacterium]
MERKRIGVLLGDKRQQYIGQIFQKWGYSVLLYDEQQERNCFEEFLLKCQTIVLPTPFALSENRIRTLICKMKRGQTLFSSKIPTSVKQELERKRVRVFDFLLEEEIAIQNAQIAAEGIIAEAMMKYRGAIYNTNCLVMGYGKCGKAIARRLQALDARVTICTIREEEIFQAREKGFLVISFENLIFHMKEQQLIFHTIPVPVIRKECFLVCDREVLVFDIVSTRVEEKLWATECGINYEVYPKIPEKYAPKAVAMIFSKYIREQIK